MALVRILAVIVIAAIVASMVVAMAFFVEYQPNIKEVNLGQQITIGPATYILSYEGIEKGRQEIKADETFMKIGIIAESPSGEQITPEKRQFILVDKGRTQTQPTHGIFAEDSPQVIAYFPLQAGKLDEDIQYKIMIRPTKEQGSTDLGFVCVTNCEAGDQ